MQNCGSQEKKTTVEPALNVFQYINYIYSTGGVLLYFGLTLSAGILSKLQAQRSSATQNKAIFVMLGKKNNQPNLSCSKDKWYSLWRATQAMQTQ